MATQTTQTAGLAPSIQTYYDKKLLARLLPMLFHQQFGQKRPIPKNGGKTIDFRKMQSLAPATTPLVEGVTPSGNSVTMVSVTATPSQYGDYIEFSDVVDMVAIDPLVDESMDVLAEQAKDTIDRISRDVLAAGTSVQYANGRVSRATIAATDLLTVKEIRKARRTLKRNNVKPLEGGDYVAIIEPGTAYDLQDDPKWEEPVKYAGSTQIFNGEIGRIYGVRFVETTNAKKFPGAGASAIDVYATLVLGKDAYGVVDVAGSGAVQTIVKPLGSSGTADPLNQRSTVGWKTMFTAKIIEQAAMVRIEHAVSQ
ncbi:N4-gp56 family major capsid protein [Paenibacillus sambharensis]|uniref:N4-gp56 family major capsid protein n=1 Tax=Paenibacillus sambharensis TaxID=1803190 RepID=A0A2W1LTW7_9BACL|nr:N4-gp56 family major capsid protein [Paenibacillus sambharensis]PZD95231.1 N4-gp56 family major capsid protein [Paenibacillus sambharensis]